MDAEKLADASARMAADVNLLPTLRATLADQHERARRARSISEIPGYRTVGEVDAHFLRVIRHADSLRNSPEALVWIETETPALCALSEQVNAELAEHNGKQAAMRAERTAAARNGGFSRVSRSPAIDAATPALRSKLDVLTHVLAAAYENPHAFAVALDEIDAEIARFKTAINADRKAARARLSHAEVSAAVDAALAA